jgi:hypothetical protein
LVTSTAAHPFTSLFHTGGGLRVMHIQKKL